MKVKIDENMPASVADVLNQLGHETDTVRQEGLVGQDDARIWKAAQESGRFLIMQDLDFSDIRRFAPGTHFGLLLVRLRSPGRVALMERVRTLFQTEQAEDWQNCFVVATEHKLRIRYPKRPLND